MRPTRPFALAASLTAFMGCGDLPIIPLTQATIHGALVGAGPTSSISVYGRPDLIDVPTTDDLATLASHPGTNWPFELTGVPVGKVELIALISFERAERVTLDLEGGEIEETSAIVGWPIATLHVDLHAPSHQLINKGTVLAKGTPVRRKVEDGPLDLAVPGGCYDVEAMVPGLGTKTVAGVCVSSGLVQRVRIEFDDPDGSANRQGCSVTGCEHDSRCLPDGSCHEE